MHRLPRMPTQHQGMAFPRITISARLGQLAAERNIEQILEDYPYLERADILAALEFAAAAVQERELPLAHPA